MLVLVLNLPLKERHKGGLVFFLEGINFEVISHVKFSWGYSRFVILKIWIRISLMETAPYSYVVVSRGCLRSCKRWLIREATNF